jgi:hypothetical protein
MLHYTALQNALHSLRYHTKAMLHYTMKTLKSIENGTFCGILHCLAIGYNTNPVTVNQRVAGSSPASGA